VLVVEDSAVVREFLLHILRSDPEVEVVGTATDGEEALQAVERTRPDVITMDVVMPKMNGFEATRRIMETRPTPIVIVSGTPDITEITSAFRAIEAGALSVLPRPTGVGHPQHERTAADLIRSLKTMSEVKVIRRWRRSRSQDLAPGASLPAETLLPTGLANVAIVAIGASTGGPPVLQTILSRLGQTFPVPVLIVQHIAAGFTNGFVEWLAQSASLPVHLANQAEPVLAGHAYVAPEGFHMKVSARGRVSLTQEEPENGLRPSVSFLFRSVAKVYGANAIGVLLTGMGKDGARELKLMNEQGAVTIAQDRESSVVHGMPGEAIRLGAATYILSSEKIAAALTSLVGTRWEEQPHNADNKQDASEGSAGTVTGPWAENEKL
jgi:two-component system chemotaxis response regulator CheB